jgi:Kef-type K+ transport system membrane component KefB
MIAILFSLTTEIDMMWGTFLAGIAFSKVAVELERARTHCHSKCKSEKIKCRQHLLLCLYFFCVTLLALSIDYIK